MLMTRFLSSAFISQVVHHERCSISAIRVDFPLWEVLKTYLFRYLGNSLEPLSTNAWWFQMLYRIILIILLVSWALLASSSRLQSPCTQFSSNAAFSKWDKLTLWVGSSVIKFFRKCNTSTHTKIAEYLVELPPYDIRSLRRMSKGKGNNLLLILSYSFTLINGTALMVSYQTTIDPLYSRLTPSMCRALKRVSDICYSKPICSGVWVQLRAHYILFICSKEISTFTL